MSAGELVRLKVLEARRQVQRHASDVGSSEVQGTPPEPDLLWSGRRVYRSERFRTPSKPRLEPISRLTAQRRVSAVAQITTRVEAITRHLATNRKDSVSKRGLAMLLERRRKLLKCASQRLSLAAQAQATA